MPVPSRVALAVWLSLLTVPVMAAESITVYRSPTCGCCLKWADYLESEGYKTTVVDSEDIDSVKTKLHVPDELQACHTAIVGDYVIEGHVPAEAIKKLLADKPKVAGIAVPGMPLGSPGMPASVPSAKEHFDAYAFSARGTSVFMSF